MITTFKAKLEIKILLFSVRRSWDNYEVFGHIESVTSSDYKNAAYFGLKVCLYYRVHNILYRYINFKNEFVYYFVKYKFLLQIANSVLIYCNKQEQQLTVNKNNR